jgi:hypothetical protein
MLAWVPTVSADQSRPSTPPVHLPLRHALPHGNPAVAAGAPQGYIPCDIIRAYHLDLLHSTGITGSNQLIAVVDALDNPNAGADLRAFDAAFGLPDPVFNVYNLGATPGSAVNNVWDHEIDLDVQWAHAAAPGASIALVEVADTSVASLIGGVNYAVNTLAADVVSMSWGSAEFTGETGFDRGFLSTNPNGKPVTYVAAAGDNGFGTSWPAASPQVMAVGGTSLSSAAVGGDTQQSHYNCFGMKSSAGVTSQNETVWGTPACTASNCPGTGGGTSTIEPKPAWQAGFGPAGGRSMPDVAMLADPSTGVALYTNGAWSAYQWGGTSLSAPLWAGVIALFNQQRRASNLGNLSITPSAFWAYQMATLNDIVSGSSPSRASDSCRSTGACVAAPGYDQVTGRGSPIGAVPWEPLGGSLTGAPDAASRGAGLLDVFARGAGNALVHRSWSSGRWGAWESLGGSLSSAPGAVAWSAGRLDVFARGGDMGLWHQWWNGTAWSGWESLGGSLTSGPDVSSWSQGRLDVFGRGGDNGLWHKFWDGARWSGWESLGGGLSSDPGAVSWGGNRIDVFARGTDNQMWHMAWDGQRWNAWEPFAGALSSGPDAAAPAGSQLDVYSLTGAGRLQHRAYAGRWGDWLGVGGQWASDPGVVSQRNGSVDLFQQGGDNQLWHTRLPSPML